MRIEYCVVCNRRSKILDEMIDILGKDNNRKEFIGVVKDEDITEQIEKD